MQLKLAALALSSSLLVAAQNTVVLVGSTADAPAGGYFQFIPPTLSAKKGDTVTFKFTGTPGNHTITQSSFADPCKPLAGGFDSGYVFIPPSNVSTTPEWNLTITDDSKPIWFFCKQNLPLVHCASGMVGAINPPTTGEDTFANFQNAAKTFKGAVAQAQGGLAGQGASASVYPSPITGGASFYTAAPASTNTSPASTKSGGAPAATGTSAAVSLGLGVDALVLLAVSGALLGGGAILF